MACCICKKAYIEELYPSELHFKSVYEHYMKVGMLLCPVDVRVVLDRICHSLQISIVHILYLVFGTLVKLVYTLK